MSSVLLQIVSFIFTKNKFRQHSLETSGKVKLKLLLYIEGKSIMHTFPDGALINLSAEKADPINEKIHFFYYRLTKGISSILSYVKEDVRLWFRTTRPRDSFLLYRHLCLKLAFE